MVTPKSPPSIPLPDVRVMVRKWAVDSGRRVSDRRVACGLDRRQLAALINTSEQTILKVEAGSINARDHLKLAIAAALEVEAEVLWPMPRRTEVLALAADETAA